MISIKSMWRTARSWLAVVLGLDRPRDRKFWLLTAALLAVAGAYVAHTWWYMPYQGSQRMRQIFASHMDQDKPGLSAVLFEHLDQAEPREEMEIAQSWHLPNLESFPAKHQRNFVIRWLGVLYIDQGGRYGFGGTVDDGLIILVDGQPVVHEWYQTSPQEVWGKVRLSEGVHALEIYYMQLAGDATLDLVWQPPDQNREPLPVSKLRALKNPLPLGDIARIRLEYNMLEGEPSTYNPFTGGRFWRLPW